MARDGGFHECCVLYDKTLTDASTVENIDSLQDSTVHVSCTMHTTKISRWYSKCTAVVAWEYFDTCWFRSLDDLVL